MTNLGLTPESRELDDLMDEKQNTPKEELNHEWLKQNENFYASHNKSTKLIKTVTAILGCSSMGIYSEIVGPTIPDLKDRVDANYEEIARALVARSVGYCFGAVIGGILAHRNPTHLELFIFLSCLFGAIGSAVVPWCRDLWMLALMLHIEGWGQAFINTGTDTMILAMWGKDAASPVHALHFGFGMGAVLAPLLARPFIAERNLEGLNGGEISPNTSTSLHEASSSPVSASLSPSFSNASSSPLTTTSLPGLESDIQIPYSISALYSFIFCLLFLGFYLKDYYKRKAFEIQKARIQRQRANLSTFSSTKDFLKSFSPGSCTGGNATFGLMIFTLIFLYYGNVVGGERAYGRFIFSYAIKSNQGFSSSDAAMLNSIFWIGFTSGRGLSSILAYWCPVHILIIVEMTANVISGIALSIWGSSVPAVLWVFTGVLGLFLSPIFPSGLAWSNMYVEMKGLAVTVVYIGASVGAIVYQWVTGYLFEYEGEATLMYVILGYALFISLTFILMVIVVRPHSKRFDNGQH